MTTFDQPAIDFDATPDGFHLEPGRCPNAGRACNCPGYCKPKLVRDEPIDFDAVSAPISGETKAVVEMVGNDWRADEDWRRFKEAVRGAAANDGAPHVAPDVVRCLLTNGRGDLTINPRRLSAFYNRAVAQGLLEFSHWGINGDTKGRNAGRPARIYRLVTA